MLLNFAVTFAVGAFTSDAPDEVRQMVEDIHVPTGAGESNDH